MPRELWFDDRYGIEYNIEPASPHGWFEMACQVASGSAEFQKIKVGFRGDDSGESEERTQKAILRQLTGFAELYRQHHHLGPDIKFKAIETDPPPKEPDWREREEEYFEDGLYTIEWNTRCRWFWIVRQMARDSQVFVADPTRFSTDPGASKEQILSWLRSFAEVSRETHHLEPDIKFKAIEIDPHAPEIGEDETSGNEVAEEDHELEVMSEENTNEENDDADSEDLKGPLSLESLPVLDLELARCRQCDHIFLRQWIRSLAIPCEQCGAAAAWQLSIPHAPQSPARNPSQLNVDQLRFFTGQSFERFLKMLFENMGYCVEETPATTDQGADLILSDDSGQKIAVQAKRYNQDVGNAAVQEILGGIAYWGCHSGIVVSASGFTRAAKDLVSKATAVILWDKPVLEVLIDRYMSNVAVFIAEKQNLSQSL